MCAAMRSLLRDAGLGVLAIAWAGACSVQEFDTVEPAQKLVNTCTTDSDCGSNGTYEGVCAGTICVASSTDIETAYLEVVPSASAYHGAGVSFLLPLDELSQGWSGELRTPQYAEVVGRITASAALLGDPPSEACESAYDATTQTLGVHVELSRSDAVRGLPALSVAANAEASATGWEFDAKVPPGKYDVYATLLAGCDADFPPIFAPAQPLAEGEVPLEIAIGSISTVSGVVATPAASLKDWTVGLVDPDSGRPISTTAKLNDSRPTNFSIRYIARDGVAPLLQMTPPKDTIAPTILWDLAVLDLDGDGKVQPDLSALKLATVRVRARMIDASINPIVGASVRIRSTNLQKSAPGLSARYETVVTAAADGSIEVDLLPGSYQVIVIPPDDTELGITTTSWKITNEQPSRAVEVTAMQALEGRVIAPGNDLPFAEVQVSVVPSAVGILSFLDRALSPMDATPRTTSTFTNDQGSFVLPVDPGLVDLSVRLPEGSNFPWLVRGRVQTSDPDLGELRVTFPIPISGTLQDPSGKKVQRALLRLYAPLDSSEPTGFARTRELGADGVLVVAEGRTDDDGKFTLMLPSKLSTK